MENDFEYLQMDSCLGNTWRWTLGTCRYLYLEIDWVLGDGLVLFVYLKMKLIPLEDNSRRIRWILDTWKWTVATWKWTVATWR